MESFSLAYRLLADARVYGENDLVRFLLTGFPIDRDLNLCRELLQLFQRAGPVCVSAHDAYSQSTFLEVPPEFDSAGCLTRALYSHQHQFPETSRLNLDLGRLLPDELGHLLVENLDDVLPSADTRGEFLA